MHHRFYSFFCLLDEGFIILYFHPLDHKCETKVRSSSNLKATRKNVNQTAQQLQRCLLVHCLSDRLSENWRWFTMNKYVFQWLLYTLFKLKWTCFPVTLVVMGKSKINWLHNCWSCKWFTLIVCNTFSLFYCRR